MLHENRASSARHKHWQRQIVTNRKYCFVSDKIIYLLPILFDFAVGFSSDISHLTAIKLNSPEVRS